MCGIAGYVGEGNRSALERMAQVLGHRGPDARGVWCDQHAGLAHARLAIQDLTQAGSQPMSAKGVHLSFNGEIYNAPCLREQLIKKGHLFRGLSDTEVILRGYLQWGRMVVSRLSGMFAIAIWDEPQQTLLLARDRVGIKPLFYSEHAEGLIFGSELKSIFVHGAIQKSLNRSMIDAYLALGYVPSPNTIFEGVHMLQPAHLLVWSSEGCELEKYWQPESRLVTGSEEDLTDELDKRLNDTVASHLLADVDIGAFLSGGVDSSLVCAIAAKQMGEPLQTFTIGFEGGGDEREWARMVAKHIGSEHQESVVDLDLCERLPGLLQHLEQPLFDNSILPTYFVSQMASKSVKVVLAGDGGDEPFFGYDWTRRALTIPRLLPPVSFSGWEWAYRTGKAGLLERLLFDVSHDSDARYLRRITTEDSFRHWLYTPEYRGELIGDALTGLKTDLGRHKDESRFAHCDLRNYLPEDVLFKVDRMSMAHGLEVRVPLLDHELLQWEMNLPVSMRFRQGRGKYLLRMVAARYLPAAILKPRKQGFTVPVGSWLGGELGRWAESIFTSQSFLQRGIIQQDRALELLRMHQSGKYELGHRIWSLIVLEVWFQCWVDE